MIESEPVAWLGFTPDADKLVVISARGQVSVRDVLTGRRIGSFKVPLPLTQLRDASIGPDGNTLRCFDVRSSLSAWSLDGKPLGTHQTLKVKGDKYATSRFARFSPDSRRLAWLSGMGAMGLVDAASGQIAFEKKPGHTLFNAIAVSPDSNRLAVWHANDGGSIVRLDKGGKAEPLTGSKEPSTDLCFSPDGRWLARGRQDGQVELYDIGGRTDPCTFVLARPGNAITHVAFGPDGNTLAVAALGLPVSIRSVPEGRVLRELPATAAGEALVALSADGHVAATSGPQTVRLFGPDGREMPPRLPGHRAPVLAAEFVDGGGRIASLDATGELLLWDADGGQVLGKDKLPLPVVGMWADPNGRQLAVLAGGPVVLYDLDKVGEDGNLAAARRILDANSFVLDPGLAGELLNRPLGVCVWRNRVRFGPIGQALTILTPTGALRTLDLRGGSIAGDPVPVVAPTNRMHLDPTGRLILTYGSSAEMVRTGERLTPVFMGLVTDLAGTMLAEPRLPDSPGMAQFLPDGELVAISSHQGKVTLLELNSGRAAWSSQVGSVTAMACSPDGQVLAVATGSTIHFLDVAAGKELATRTGHEQEIVSLAFSPDGNRIVSGSADTTVIVWKSELKRPAIDDADEKQSEDLWKQMADDDPAQGHAAAMTLARSGPRAVAFLAERVNPVPGADTQKVRELIRQLDDNEYAVRQAAQEALAAMGARIQGEVRRALESPASEEQRCRLEMLLGPVSTWLERHGEALRARRAIRALEYRADANALALLKRLAAGASGAHLTTDAAGALQRIQARASR